MAQEQEARSSTPLGRPTRPLSDPFHCLPLPETRRPQLAHFFRLLLLVFSLHNSPLGCLNGGAVCFHKRERASKNNKVHSNVPTSCWRDHISPAKIGGHAINKMKCIKLNGPVHRMEIKGEAPNFGELLCSSAPLLLCSIATSLANKRTELTKSCPPFLMMQNVSRQCSSARRATLMHCRASHIQSRPTRPLDGCGREQG